MVWDGVRDGVGVGVCYAYLDGIWVLSRGGIAVRWLDVGVLGEMVECMRCFSYVYLHICPSSLGAVLDSLGSRAG